MQYFLLSLLLILIAPLSGAEAESALRETGSAPGADASLAEVTVACVEAGKPEHRLAVRVVVTASDGSHADGAGNGLYADGRFFADGAFTVKIPPGETKLLIRAGPDYAPLETRLTAVAGRAQKFEAALLCWFSPESRGWFAGDNHVHVKHDSKGKIKTSFPYTALQGRANGLSYITEAGSSIKSANDDEADRPDFLFRHASEIRPGPFVGHRNSPGLRTPLPLAKLERLISRPLPTQALLEPVRADGGALIYTHPMMPPHLLHWMGAAEAWSDGVLGRCGDAMDLDGRHTEWLWFALLNMGNHVAASGSTDAALERAQTPSPGDRRVYAHAGKLTYEGCVNAIRAGKTFASNAGPLFAFLSIDGHESGDVLKLGPNQTPGPARVEVQALNALRKAQLISGGQVLKEFKTNNKRGESVFTFDLPPLPDGESWYIVRAEDERGNWAITRPIYVRRKDGPGALRDPNAALTMLTIANHTRFVELRKDFFAHIIVTCCAGIEAVELLRGEEVIHTFRPADGNQVVNNAIPVTGMNGEYAAGWIWHNENGKFEHLQADWPVADSGTYALRVKSAGLDIVSDGIVFDAKGADSRALSVANLKSGQTKLTHWGYGEEMPLAEVRKPFEGDHWWYPKNTFWRMESSFGGKLEELSGGKTEAKRNFVSRQK